MKLKNLNFRIASRIYVALALAAAAVFSSSGYSLVPLILLAWYLILWRWHISPVVNLFTQYFVFFSLCLLYLPIIGPNWPLLLSIPVLYQLDHALKETAISTPRHKTHLQLRPTNMGITILTIDLAVILISLALNVMTLLAASLIIMLYLAVLMLIVMRYLPLKPVEEEPINLRVIAGRQMQAEAGMKVKTGIGARLFLLTREAWIKVHPEVFQLKGERLAVQISVTPSLSGPASVELEGYALDQWGLFQVRFTIQPVKLMVIPRARYARWVAEKYLQGTRQGELPLIANVSSMQTTYGLRRGIEYYGNKMYQPGDSLKNIDWKHTYKYNELVVKEFAESHGQSVIALINLVAGNDEEKDILAYNILVTAVTLAQESVPVVMAAYNDKEVTTATEMLHGQQLILQAFKTVKEIIIRPEPYRYLGPPDVRRIRAEIHRMQQLDNKPANKLGQLLQMEYHNISLSAKNSQLTAAFNKAIYGLNRQAMVVVISRHNHDSDALAFDEYMFYRNSTSLIYI